MEPTDPINELREPIKRYGWAVRKGAPRVGEERAEFAYTVGLTTLGHPEVVIYGLPGEAAHEFLNDIGTKVRDGVRFQPGENTFDLAEDEVPIAFIDATNTADLIAVSVIYGKVRALQMAGAMRGVGSLDRRVRRTGVRAALDGRWPRR